MSRSATAATPSSSSTSLPRLLSARPLVWVFQFLLAVAFLAHGLMFLFPPPEIAVLMNQTLPRWFQLFLGVAEVLAAIGLTLPALTGIQAWLVTWAAGGIIVVMISATLWHIARAEYSSAVITAILLGMAAVVARTPQARRRNTQAG